MNRKIKKNVKLPDIESNTELNLCLKIVNMHIACGNLLNDLGFTVTIFIHNYRLMKSLPVN